MKLSAKFARQETEEARLARIARRRIREDQSEAVRRMLGLPATIQRPTEHDIRNKNAPERTLSCPRCDRRFALPMHLGRHMQTIHRDIDGA